MFFLDKKLALNTLLCFLLLFSFFSSQKIDKLNQTRRKIYCYYTSDTLMDWSKRFFLSLNRTANNFFLDFLLFFVRLQKQFVLLSYVGTRTSKSWGLDFCFLLGELDFWWRILTFQLLLSIRIDKWNYGEIINDGWMIYGSLNDHAKSWIMGERKRKKVFLLLHFFVLARTKVEFKNIQ